MIVSIDVNKILPDAYREMMFEFRDQVTLAHLRLHYGRKFSEGSIVGWTNPDFGDEIKIMFENDEDATMFLLRWS